MCYVLYLVKGFNATCITLVTGVWWDALKITHFVLFHCWCIVWLAFLYCLTKTGDRTAYFLLYKLNSENVFFCLVTKYLASSY